MNGAVSGTQCWSLLLADWALRGAITSSALVNRSPCGEPTHNLYPWCHNHFVHQPIGRWQGWLGREDDWYPWNGLCYPLITNIILCWGNLFVRIHIGNKYLPIFCPFERSLYTYLFPKLPCHQFSHVPWKSLNIQPWIGITHKAIIFKKPNFYVNT